MDSENLKSRLLRYGFNLFPAFRASGAWLTYIGPDMRCVRLKLPLKRKTRNYVGTVYGGSMYSAVDGIYMVMLIRNLGRGYVVWDKSATIRYRKPAKSTLYVDFELTQDELDTIEARVASEGKVERDFPIQLKDASGTVCAEVVKTIHITRKAR